MILYAMKMTVEEKTTCTLYLQSDPILTDEGSLPEIVQYGPLFLFLFTGRYLEETGGNREVATQEILAMFAAHVMTVNNILAKTRFQTFDGAIDYGRI